MTDLREYIASLCREEIFKEVCEQFGEKNRTPCLDSDGVDEFCLPEPRYRNDDKMMFVIALQQRHGKWEVSGQLLKLLGIPKEQFDKQKFSEVPSIVCTVLVLCWLRKQFSHRHEEWQVIETKALTWLASQKVSTSVEDIIQQTTQSLWSE